MDGKENEIANGEGAEGAVQAEGQAGAQAAGPAGATAVGADGSPAGGEAGPTAAGKQAVDYAAEIADRDARIAERDGRIAELEGQLAAAANMGDENAALRSEVEQLKNQAASDRVDFALQLAGCRNVKAARAVLADYDGDVEALKSAEAWLFERDGADGGAAKGATGLPNAGAAADSEKLTKRLRRAAGLPEKKE